MRSKLRDAVILDPFQGILGRGDIIVDGGVISEVSISADLSDEDLSGDAEKIIVPSFIDLHVHLREPGFEYKEDIESGSRAALAGGFRTIFCMPNTKPVNDSVATTRYIKGRAKEIGLVDIYPVGAITKNLEGKGLADIEGMASEGVIAISDDGSSVQDAALMEEAMSVAKRLGLLVISHAEDFSIGQDGVINEGKVSKRLRLKGIPRESENKIIERDIALAKKTGARLHIAHVSTKEGLAMVREAKKRGLAVTCEATPHHLLLTDEDVERLGANAKMKPPLRTEEDRRALVLGLSDGTIDAIATDHAPHAPREKSDLATAAFGVIGMETAFSACMRLVKVGDITLRRLVELLTVGPARVVGLKYKGIVKGEPARLTSIDLKSKEPIRLEDLKSKSKNTPFIGPDFVRYVSPRFCLEGATRLI
jgi:dihydroorotase